MFTVFSKAVSFLRKKKRPTIEILPRDPLKLMVGGYFPEHFSKMNVVFRTEVVFLSHKTSLATAGTRLQTCYKILKATCRETAAGELLPEVPTALKQRWYFMLLPCCVGNLFFALLT